MLLGCLKHRTEADLRSRRIDKELGSLNRKFENAIKILLLGTAESGKTTIIKQMKILHINGFTDDDKRDKIKEIRQNVHESIRELVIQMRKFKYLYDIDRNQKWGQLIEDIGPKVPEPITYDYIEWVSSVWNDQGIRDCYRRSNEFHLIDSAKYFLDKFPIISASNYMPTVDDILHSRRITTGIHQITFSVKIPKSMGGGLQEFRMIDVGGQRDQRNKWLQVFEGIQAVLFIISCADFDQTLREDHNQNRFVEAMNLFRGVWHNRFLASAGLIIFLNKQDLLEEKIQRGVRIENYFPDYKQFHISAKDGNIFDECDRGRLFIKQKLINITREPPRRTSELSSYVPRECYYHFTIATDTNNIRKVFSDVHNMILTDNLTSVGLL